MYIRNAIIKEVCCGSLDDAILAEEAGADRIELNSCLQQGGLTPSLGTLIEIKKSLKNNVKTEDFNKNLALSMLDDNEKQLPLRWLYLLN